MPPAATPKRVPSSSGIAGTTELRKPPQLAPTTLPTKTPLRSTEASSALSTSVSLAKTASIKTPASKISIPCSILGISNRAQRLRHMRNVSVWYSTKAAAAFFNWSAEGLFLSSDLCQRSSASPHKARGPEVESSSRPLAEAYSC